MERQETEKQQREELAAAFWECRRFQEGYAKQRKGKNKKRKCPCGEDPCKYRKYKHCSHCGMIMKKHCSKKACADAGNNASLVGIDP